MQKPGPSERIVIGLTGSFGSGKSTVASIFRSQGAVVFDADKIVHRLIAPGTPVYRRVVREFGTGILHSDKSINRHTLGVLVFGKKSLLVRLNAIIHPEVIRIISKGLKRVRQGIAVIDAPLLFEAGLEKKADVLIVVKASRQNQIRRVQKRSSLATSAIVKRIRSQIPLCQKLGRADFVIDNDGTISETRKQVARIRRQLWRS
jgi:dephospho-CoA kinase